MTNKSNFSHAYTYLDQHKEQAMERALQPRVTDEHSTGDAMIDEYLGGGFGRKNGYEIVLLFGDTGCNKSTFATQMILDSAEKGKQIGYFSLEDDVDDLFARIYFQCKAKVSGNLGEPTELVDKITQNIIVAPESDGYTLEEMAQEIEALFDMGIDIIVIDPLQFIFEASVVEKTETEFNRQRLFMRQINNLVKRASRASGESKTIILVSHTNKGKYDNAIDNIMGSGANKQVPTKIIEIGRDKNDGTRYLHLHKSRFTEHRFGRHQVHLNKTTMTLRTVSAPDPDWKDQVRKAWAGGVQ